LIGTFQISAEFCPPFHRGFPHWLRRGTANRSSGHTGAKHKDVGCVAALAIAGSMALPHCNLRRRNRSRIAIDRRVSLSRKREDLRLDIERKRAMFPKDKISRPGFLRSIACWRMTPRLVTLWTLRLPDGRGPKTV